MDTRLVSFLGGQQGSWAVIRQQVIRGADWPMLPRLDMRSGSAEAPEGGWALRGIRSNERYVQLNEREQLVAVQEDLGRTAATCAALIPIRKTPQWWALTQQERRAIFAEQSRHIQIGLDYLPAVARRLLHCRDMAVAEPFDFLTWFEYAPEHEALFDQLLAELRATAEWQFIDWEIDIRLSRANDGASFV